MKVLALIGIFAMNSTVLAQATAHSPADTLRHRFYAIFRDPDALLPVDTLDLKDMAALNTNPYPVQLDSVLNSVYSAVLAKFRKQHAFVLWLKRAEDAWLNYRNAELQAIIPPERSPENRGGMEGMCWGEYKAALDRERIGELLMWLQHGGDQSGCDSFVNDADVNVLSSVKPPSSRKNP